MLSLSEVLMNTKDQKTTEVLLRELCIREGLVDAWFYKSMCIISGIHSSGKEEVNFTVTIGLC